jgi:chromosome segregation ATPase
MQELAPNPELARRNKELEDRLRVVTVDAENLRFQVEAMAREVSGLHSHVEKAQQEKELTMRSYEGKQGAQAQWEDKCKALEAEVAHLKEELSKTKAASIPKKNYAIDEI